MVEGIKYILEVEVVNTMCRKNSGDGFKNVDLENCALPPKAEQQVRWQNSATPVLQRLGFI